MARADGYFSVIVVGETGVVHEGTCEALFVPGVREQLVVLAFHTPMIAKLTQGDIVIKSGKSRQTLATIDTGLLYVGDNEATVLLNL